MSTLEPVAAIEIAKMTETKMIPARWHNASLLARLQPSVTNSAAVALDMDVLLQLDDLVQAMVTRLSGLREAHFHNRHLPHVREEIGNGKCKGAHV